MRNRSIDWFVLIPVLLLLSIGLIMVLSASSPITVAGKSRDAFLIFRKQLTWVGIGLAVMYLTANYNYRKLRKHVVPAAVLTVILLLVVFAFQAKNGAHSWIEFGGFQFQPSEFVKLCVVLILAKMMSAKGAKMDSFNEGLAPAVLVVAAVCGLILLEPDLGTAMVIAITSFIMLFAGGARGSHLGILALIGTILAGSAIAVADYRLERVFSFINPLKDPSGGGFQITQSLYAIGSGGMIGVGLGRSMQKYYYVPEQHTDFIFSILAEELGFIGAAFVILLFIFFAARSFRIAKNSRDSFGSLLACGLTTMILVEAMINIAVVTSTMPVTGITLPFISYGGSSLVFKMAAVGIIMNVSRYVERTDTVISGTEPGKHTAY